MRSLQDRIALMEQQLRALRGRHHQAEVKRKREMSAQARREEERRRLLVGTLILKKVTLGEISESQFRAWLREGLVDVDDRKLFDL